MQQRLCNRPSTRLYKESRFKAFLGPNANINACVLSTYGLELTIQISMLDVRIYVKKNMFATEREIKPTFILGGGGQGRMLEPYAAAYIATV